ncbi:hypothetical protein ACQKWADRAFT_120719 [Trichoderma austrokoningii]
MQQLVFRPLIFLSLLPLIKAYTVFETTCSAPNPQSSFIFVSAPDARGTLNILWSSLFTIFACTWTLQHPNVPEQRSARKPGRLSDVELVLGRLLWSCCWMIVTILGPEYIISKAWEDLIKARKVQKMMRDYVCQDGVAWSLTHSYYAKMGGFAIKSKPQGTLHCLSAEQVLELRRTEVIKALPNVNIEEITDKSKGDTFSKAIAICQALWAMVQIIARAAKSLPVSPLEVAVVAFAACAVIIYGLYWYKPQRVSTPIAILHYVNGREETLDEILKACYAMKTNHASGNMGVGTKSEPEVTVTTARSNRDAQPEEWGSVVAGAIGATIFGAIHVVAWDFAFPTRLELIWWRCASVYTAAFPLGLAMSVLVVYTTLKWCGVSDRMRTFVVYLLVAVSMSLYVVARYFILVEIFRTLFFLPAGSFVSTWSSNIPHVG